MALQNKKSLGQNWLKDPEVLERIVDLAELTDEDTVLEIGPGLGTLTSRLLGRAGSVVAVEFDKDLARKLPGQFPGKNLTVVTGDVLSFDLGSLPSGYKVVANIPYYITSKIIRLLMEAENKPGLAVLLTQKEVAERLAAQPGDMSVLGISAQVSAEVTLGPVVPAELFTPPPQVDSQVVVLKTRQTPLLHADDEKIFYQLVKYGFSSKRKKLRSSLAGGMRIAKDDVVRLLRRAEIDENSRAEDLSIDDWKRLMQVIHDRV